MHGVDLDDYCGHEIQRHQPTVDSPFLSGAIAGALIATCIRLLLQFIPEIYPFVAAGETMSSIYRFWQPLFTTLAIGGVFGGVTLWIVSCMVGRLQITFEAAHRGFYVGGIAGAVLGASIVIARELSSSSSAIGMNWNIYSTEVAAYSLALAAFGATLLSFVSAVWCRPNRLANLTEDSAILEDQNRVINAPEFDRLSRFRDADRIRFQFGVKRLMTLTAFIAVLIGCPSFIYKQLMTMPALQPFRLEFAVTLVALALFVFPYGLWVVLRGPTVFARLTSSIGAWRRLRSLTASGTELRDSVSSDP